MSATTRRSRIILIAPGPGTRGGIAQFNAELTRRLREQDASATLLAYRRTDPIFGRGGHRGADTGAQQEEVPSDSRLVLWFPWTWVGAASFRWRVPPADFV